VPLVVLATIAAVIAAQATIAATFSVTQASISLGFLPRMKVMHTSEREIGQIYIPLANWLQMMIVLLAIVGFGSSTALAAAYGIAVTTTMLATTILTFFVIHYRWKLNWGLSMAATGFFLVIDVAFLAANSLKIADGGWFPLALGGAIMAVMLIWRTGRSALATNLQQHAIPLGAFLESLFASPPVRVPGNAVFFRAEGDGVPHALLHNLLHNKVLHEQIVFLTVVNCDIPSVPAEERLTMTALGHRCYQLDVKYGFKDDRDILAALEQAVTHGLEFNLMETSFFIARQTVIPAPGGRMPMLGDSIFASMYRNARDAAEYYKLPANRVIELGTQIEI
jgi:KUP system potassium uptake protein